MSREVWVGIFKHCASAATVGKAGCGFSIEQYSSRVALGRFQFGAML